MIFGAIDPQEI